MRQRMRWSPRSCTARGRGGRHARCHRASPRLGCERLSWRAGSLTPVGVAEPSSMRSVAALALRLGITERVDLLICPAKLACLVPADHVAYVQGVRPACLAGPVDASPAACAGGVAPPPVGDGRPPVRPLQQWIPGGMGRHGCPAIRCPEVEGGGCLPPSFQGSACVPCRVDIARCVRSGRWDGVSGWRRGRVFLGGELANARAAATPSGAASHLDAPVE
jgi:hypothetical protein